MVYNEVLWSVLSVLRDIGSRKEGQAARSQLVLLVEGDNVQPGLNVLLHSSMQKS